MDSSYGLADKQLEVIEVFNKAFAFVTNDTYAEAFHY
jgi:hypothetical protein